MNQSEEQGGNYQKCTEPERPVEYQECQHVCSRVPEGDQTEEGRENAGLVMAQIFPN